MAYDDRKLLIEEIENKRNGRTLISLCNFDRASQPKIPGLEIPFFADCKECLYRLLKESPAENGIDLFLYTRGGDTNSVWPIVCLLREFDIDFEVLVPFRAHSAGTMLALSAKKILMTSIGELSPIDATAGNQFNPRDPVDQRNRLGISVEDVHAYQDFIKSAFRLKSKREVKAILQPFIHKLTDEVHPLAIGNVHRIHQLISRLAKDLMELHPIPGRDISEVVKRLTVETYSHLHMIGRKEAKEILGSEHVEATSPELERALDKLLKKYEDDFQLRHPFFIHRFMRENEQTKPFRFIGSVLESKHWGYVFETIGKIIQFNEFPQGVNLQLQPGQKLPIIPDLPRRFDYEIHEQRWHRNTQPEGVSL